MDSFRECLDRITAEEELKEKTRAYVEAALSERDQKDTDPTTPEAKEKSPPRLLVAALSAAACMFLAVGGYAYYTPVKYISVDINPSVELGINAFGRVVTAEGYNEDGNLLLKENRLTSLPVAAALRSLIEEAAERGYISEDGSTVIAVTAESDDGRDASELQDKSAESVGEALETKNIQAIIYANCSSLELRAEAKELGVSPGKYKLFEIAKAIDPDITIEEFMDSKTTAILTTLDELLSKAENREELVDKFDGAIDGISDAAAKVKGIEESGKKGAEDKQEEEKQLKGSGPDSGTADAGAAESGEKKPASPDKQPAKIQSGQDAEQAAAQKISRDKTAKEDGKDNKGGKDSKGCGKGEKDKKDDSNLKDGKEQGKAGYEKSCRSVKEPSKAENGKRGRAGGMRVKSVPQRHRNKDSGSGKYAASPDKGQGKKP